MPDVQERHAGTIAGLLGDVGQNPDDPFDAHDKLMAGLSGTSLLHLIDNLKVLRKPSLIEKAVGMSIRTLQRCREFPAKRLSPEQSGRAWKFSEVLAQATKVFGSQREAEEWMERPAMGLDQRRPIDLLATPAGTEIVENFLTRLEYSGFA
jgi:putative toxin-antitoxin system antitoxin component (TIGR02293 family)